MKRLAPYLGRDVTMHHTMRRLLRLTRWLAAGLLLLAVAALALFLLARAALAPGPEDHWTTRIGSGRLSMEASMPSLVLLATAPWVGPWLHGHKLRTPHGVVHMAWVKRTRTLALRCSPCTVAMPALGSGPVQVQDLRLTVRREGVQLRGEASAVGGAGVINAKWRGQIDKSSLQLNASTDEAPVAQWYALLAPQLPELRHGHIAGTLALDAQVMLPQGKLVLKPSLKGFRVSGLGTDAWVHARTSCGRRSGLRQDAWLARAVIAAEDQRFYEHGGYDLAELSAALGLNQSQGQVARGGSTLSQQLAKLLVTGSERSLQRKLRELLYAVEMEETLSKARILRLYLDNAPWGPGICGAESASRHYFGTPARKLEPAQAVWLAAMLNNPGMHAREWAASGQIDLKRAQWVGNNLRGGVGRRQREAVVESIAAAEWATGTAED